MQHFQKCVAHWTLTTPSFLLGMYGNWTAWHVWRCFACARLFMREEVILSICKLTRNYNWFWLWAHNAVILLQTRIAVHIQTISSCTTLLKKVMKSTHTPLVQTSTAWLFVASHNGMVDRFITFQKISFVVPVLHVVHKIQRIDQPIRIAHTAFIIEWYTFLSHGKSLCRYMQ